MQVVIDIPEENYKRLKSMYEMDTLYNPYLMAIAKGTSLQKGHGRMIDADALLKCIPTEDLNSILTVICAPTIIEADKG